MPNTARVIRSIPFWVLVGGSLVAVGGGVYLLVDKLTVMASTLADGTATGVEVYAGQIWAVLGAILIGVGLIAFVFDVTRDKLLRMGWFRRLYQFVIDLRAKAAEIVAPFKRAIGEWITRFRRRASPGFIKRLRRRMQAPRSSS